MPSSPFDYQVYAAILAACAVPNGSAPYHYDLTGKVAEGLPPASAPPFEVLPCVAVGYGGVEMEDGPDLPGTSDRMEFHLQAWAPAATQDASGRIQAAARLASDLRQALRAARASGSSSALYHVHNLRFRALPVDAEQMGVALGCGFLVGTITCEIPVSYGETE